MQYHTTRAFPTASRQYEAGDAIDPANITAAEWIRGTESGAVVPARWYGTAAELAARGIPGPGVSIYETDTKIARVGDGVNITTSLPVSGSDGFLQVANDLSEVTAATARTNLGLGAAAVMSTADIAADNALTATFAQVFKPEAYGARRDAAMTITASMTAGSATLTAAALTGADVGKAVCVLGVGASATMSAVTTATATTGGSLAAGTYGYRVGVVVFSGGNLGQGQPLIQAVSVSTSSIVVPSGTSTNTVTLSWTAVTGAVAYQVWGRTGGSEKLLATVPADHTSWLDTGGVTPLASSTLPTATTVGRPLLTTITAASSGSATLAASASVTAATTTAYWGTDDSAAISAAVTAAAVRGGEVQLGAGGYWLGSTTIALPAGVAIHGAGSAYRGAAVTFGTTLYYAGSDAAIKATSCTNIETIGVTIQAVNPSGTSMAGIWYAGVWYGNIEDVAVRGITELSGHGYAILSDVGANYGSYEINIARFDCGTSYDGGVVKVAGTGPGNFVMTTTLDTGWACRYEIVHGQATLRSVVPEGWWSTYEEDDVGGITIDGFGTVRMLTCAMEGQEITDGKTRPAIYTKPTYVGKGVYEWGTGWEGHSGIRVIGDLRGYNETIGENHYNAGLEFSKYPLAAGDRILGAQWGQQRPNGAADFAVLQTHAENVVGGSQSGYLFERRRVGGVLRDQVDHGTTWTLRNTKTLAVDNVPVTFFTIPFGQYGWGGQIRVMGLGVHIGIGALGAYRDALVATGASQIGVAIVAGTQTNITTSTGLTIGFVQSGNDLLIQAALSGGSASSVTLVADVLGLLRHGLQPN